jgi:hypothetical protein
MCLYSAQSQGFGQVPGDILAPDVQERALGLRGTDERCKRVDIPVRRNGLKARSTSGVRGAGADAKGGFWQGGACGPQAACGLGPGF